MDSYSEERQPIFVDIGETIIAAGIKSDRAFLERHIPDPDRHGFEQAWKQLESGETYGQRSFDPHYEGSPIVLGPPGSSVGVVGTHSFAARPGHHLAPQSLSSGRNVFEELGKGFTLLAFGAEDQEIRAFEQAAHPINVPLKVVRDTNEGPRTAFESRLVLVRPDQHVAWSGDELPHDVGGLIKKVAGIG